MNPVIPHFQCRVAISDLRKIVKLSIEEILGQSTTDHRKQKSKQI